MALSQKINWLNGEFAPFLDKVQSRHVFDFCLKYVERADECIISSFAINEGFIRRLLKHRDLCGELTVIWDVNMAQSNAANLLFLSKQTDALYLTSNHSKVIYMANAEKQCVAVSSVNTTGNYRYEGGFVTCNPDLVNYYKLKLDHIIDNSKPWKSYQK